MKAFVPMEDFLLEKLYKQGLVKELAENGYIAWLIENKPETIVTLSKQKRFRHWLAQNGYEEELKKLCYKCWLLKWGYISAPKETPRLTIFHPNRVGDKKLFKFL